MTKSEVSSVLQIPHYFQQIKRLTTE